MLKDEKGAQLCPVCSADLDACLLSSQNHVLERALHSSGLQSKTKKRYRDEMSRLMEQDHQMLRQENERLQAEVRNVKDDLVQSREKVRRGRRQTVVKSVNLASLSLIYQRFILSAGPSARCDRPVPEAAQTAEPGLPGEGLGAGERLPEAGARGEERTHQGTNLSR